MQPLNQPLLIVNVFQVLSEIFLLFIFFIQEAITIQQPHEFLGLHLMIIINYHLNAILYLIIQLHNYVLPFIIIQQMVIPLIEQFCLILQFGQHFIKLRDHFFNFGLFKLIHKFFKQLSLLIREKVIFQLFLPLIILLV